MLLLLTTALAWWFSVEDEVLLSPLYRRKSDNFWTVSVIARMQPYVTRAFDNFACLKVRYRGLCY